MYLASSTSKYIQVQTECTWLQVHPSTLQEHPSTVYLASSTSKYSVVGFKYIQVQCTVYLASRTSKYSVLGFKYTQYMSLLLVSILFTCINQLKAHKNPRCCLFYGTLKIGSLMHVFPSLQKRPFVIAKDRQSIVFEVCIFQLEVSGGHEPHASVTYIWGTVFRGVTRLGVRTTWGLAPTSQSSSKNKVTRCSPVDLCFLVCLRIKRTEERSDM